MVVLEDLARGLAALVGLDGDRRAVRVRAGDHQDAVALQPVIAGKDIGRQVGAGQVADVQIAVGIRPGDGNVDRVGHRGPRWAGHVGTFGGPASAAILACGGTPKGNRQPRAGGGRAAGCGRRQVRPDHADGPRSIGDGSLRMDIVTWILIRLPTSICLDILPRRRPAEKPRPPGRVGPVALAVLPGGVNAARNVQPERMEARCKGASPVCEERHRPTYRGSRGFVRFRPHQFTGICGEAG